MVAQTAALAAAETALNVRQSRLVAAVALIQALGGGWDAAQVPSQRTDRSRQPAQFQPVAAGRHLAAPAETVVRCGPIDRLVTGLDPATKPNFPVAGLDPAIHVLITNAPA